MERKRSEFPVWVLAQLHDLNVRFREVLLRRREQSGDTVEQSRRFSLHPHQAEMSRIV